jgi:phage terminase small subunit
MSQDQVLQEMALLSHSRLEHYIIDDDGQVRLAEGAPDGAMGAIQSIKRKCTVKYNDKTNELTKTYDVELRLWDKPTPLKLMGRHVGLFPDRVEITGKNGGPVETVNKIERVIVDVVPQDA